MIRTSGRFLVSMGGVWFTAWVLMLAVGRVHEVWGIRTIGMSDSMALIFFALCVRLGAAVSFAAFRKDE